MATTTVNGGSSAEGNPPVSMPGTGKQQMSKPAATGGKAVDTNRKQTSNPSEGAQRRNVPQKAWTGMNPITQRSSTPGQQNGAGPQSKSNTQKTSMNVDPRYMDQYTQERMLHLLGNFMGHTATVALKSGDVFSGIFFGATTESNESTYLLKMVQQLKSVGRGEPNGVQDDSGSLVGVGEDHAMTFDVKDISDLSVEGADIGVQDKLQNGSVSGFRTDADISGNLAIRERQLQRWAPSAETDVDLSLETSGPGGEWDQFKANEKLFGLKSDYDENIYTTAIDRSNPSYREREARAQRLAQEIEGSSIGSAHVREERGMIDEDGELDEEDKYSGVRRHGADYPPLQPSQANRYMPPARRPPTGKPTVAGAPVDPAIISSQIARSDASPQGRNPAPSNPTEPPLPATAAPSDGASLEVKRDPTKDVSTPNVVVGNNSRPGDAAKLPTPSATANVETEVRDAFKTFATFEKSRVAEDRRKRVIHDQRIKLNDLKKFSTNFKLHTPVPKDLVPILAKDTAKQHEIVEKAQREAEQKAVSPPKSLASSGDQASSSKHDGTRAPPNTATAERQDYAHSRQGYTPRGPQAGMTLRDRQQQFSNVFPAAAPNSQGMLSHRLADNHGRHKAGMPVPIPAPLPIHSVSKPPSRPSANAGPVPSSQASSTVRTPTSAVSSKFNVNARDFKPNPAANTFKPTAAPSTTSSPRSNVNVRPVSRNPSPGDFFGSKKPLPLGEKPSILGHFNPLKRLKEKAQNENKVKDYALNGGIVYAHATPVTWTQVDHDKNFKHYKDMFDAPPPASRGASPHNPTASPVNPALLHQLPPHLQHGPHGIPQVQAPQQPQYQGPPQPHHYPGPNHYDDHRMRSSPSASSAFSTPRVQAPYLAYPQAMGQPMPYPNGQPIPPYAMGPGAQQPQNFRQYHGGAPFPQSPGQQFAAPMMVHNSSQGGFMAPHPMPGPQMHMFPPGQIPPYGGQSQPPSGYPSPGRATPMMQQGSYQGQNPQMYMTGQQYGTPVYAQQPPQHTTPMRGYASPQPHYNQSPQQQPHFPPQVSRVPSNSYNHHPQGQYQHMQGQNPHPPSVPMEGGEAIK